MDHTKCLEALADLGASDLSIDSVAAFLYNRKMSVRIGNTYSAPKTVPGGSPQGSILGNFLFCSTTNCFAEIRDTEEQDISLTSSTESSEDNYSNSESDSSASDAPVNQQNTNQNSSQYHRLDLALSTPTTRGQFHPFAPPASLAGLSGVYESDDDTVQHFKIRDRLSFDTSSEDESVISIPYEETHTPMESYVYIDDYNSIERLCVTNAAAHITTNKRKVTVHAKKSEVLFNRVTEMADDVKMKINSNKTQMLCINPNPYSDMTSYINTPSNEVIRSTDSLKILGFTFGREPNAKMHVTKLIERFHSKLWTLRFLKGSGMHSRDLRKIYDTCIRTGVEYSSVVYNTLIPGYLSDQLERVQGRAMRIIYGSGESTASLYERNDVETLASRRDANSLRFANKNKDSERYGKRWFKTTDTTTVNLRQGTRRKYREPLCRTERLKNNPIYHMTRCLLYTSPSPRDLSTSRMPSSA